MEHDPLCSMQEPDPGGTVHQSSCSCDLIAQVEERTVESLALSWQVNGWAVLIPNARTRNVVGTGQVVTDWLRDQVSKFGQRS